MFLSSTCRVAVFRVVVVPNTLKFPDTVRSFVMLTLPLAANVNLGDQDGELIVPLEVYIFRPPPDIPSINAVVCGSEAVPAKAIAGVPVPFLRSKVFPPPSKVPVPAVMLPVALKAP